LADDQRRLKGEKPLERADASDILPRCTGARSPGGFATLAPIRRASSLLPAWLLIQSAYPARFCYYYILESEIGIIRNHQESELRTHAELVCGIVRATGGRRAGSNSET
jgi:hypothetical protein